MNFNNIKVWMFSSFLNFQHWNFDQVWWKERRVKTKVWCPGADMVDTFHYTMGDCQVMVDTFHYTMGDWKVMVDTFHYTMGDCQVIVDTFHYTMRDWQVEYDTYLSAQLTGFTRKC